MPRTFNSEEAFRNHYTFWKRLGMIPPTNNRTLYHMYSLGLTLIITMWYPTHLMIGLFNSKTSSEVFKNIGINLTCLSCSIKWAIAWWKLDKIDEMNRILKRLDKRVDSADERKYYQYTIYPAFKRVLYFFSFICLGAIISSEGATCIVGVLNEWRLMYPAYFPFAIKASNVNYIIAHLYQFLGVGLQIAQNFNNDTFGGVAMIMLSGHVHLLGMRVSKVGFDSKISQIQNNAELLEYIQDHRDLLDRLRTIIENIISYGMFIQIILTSVSICVTIIYIIFFVDNLYAYVYYAVFLLAMPMEIFPTCYYGTYMELEFDQLTSSILSCNWISQNETFRQNLRIFAEQSLRKRACVAAGMLPINLTSFFAACKGAYSLCAVAMQMK